jgi:hypothetical protein
VNVQLGHRQLHPAQDILEAGLVSQCTKRYSDAVVGHVRIMPLDPEIEAVEGFLRPAGR